MKHLLDFTVVESQFVNKSNFLLKLSSPSMDFSSILPGQFVEIKVDKSPTTFLRRPISIHFVDIARKELWLLIQIVGDGTQQLSTLAKGDTVSLILPLGNGFSLPQKKSRTLLIGGGVGIAPLLYLGKALQESGSEVTFLLGARTSQDFPDLSFFAPYGNVLVTTEDGSAGQRGFVTNHTVLQQNEFDAIYTCGPKPMMVAVARYAKEHDIFCEVSLENKMACGFGVCLCCVEKTVEGHKCVCTDGPVFNIEKLEWSI